MVLNNHEPKTLVSPQYSRLRIWWNCDFTRHATYIKFVAGSVILWVGIHIEYSIIGVYGINCQFRRNNLHCLRMPRISTIQTRHVQVDLQYIWMMARCLQCLLLHSSLVAVGEHWSTWGILCRRVVSPHLLHWGRCPYRVNSPLSGRRSMKRLWRSWRGMSFRETTMQIMQIFINLYGKNVLSSWQSMQNIYFCASTRLMCLSISVAINVTLPFYVWGVLREYLCITSEPTASGKRLEKAKITILLSLASGVSGAWCRWRPNSWSVPWVVCALPHCLVTGCSGRPSRVRRRIFGFWRWVV